MVPTLSLNPPASFLLPPPLSPVRCIHGPPPSSCDCSPFSCDRRGLCVKRDARPHPSYSCVRCKTSQSGSEMQSIQRGPAADRDNLLSSCCSAELDRRSPLSILHPPPPTPHPVCPYRHKQMHDGSYGWDKGSAIKSGYGINQKYHTDIKA